MDLKKYHILSYLVTLKTYVSMFLRFYAVIIYRVLPALVVGETGIQLPHSLQTFFFIF
jgi:hypothetical protein